MRLRTAAIHGIIPFPNGPAEIDFDAIPGPIIAVVGPNTAGKTTFLETIAAAFTPRRVTQTRGSLVDLAVARDTFVDVVASAGERTWRFRHDVDAHTGDSKARVVEQGGADTYKGDSVKVFDAWARKELIDTEVLFASLLRAQQDGGLLAMGKAARRSIILRALGITKIEKMAALARKWSSEAKARFELAETRLKDEQRRGYDLDNARAGLDRARADVLEAGRRLDEAQLRLHNTRAAAKEAQDHNAAVQVERVEYGKAETSVSHAATILNNAEARLRGARDKVDRLAAQIAEAEKLPALRAELARIETGIKALDTVIESLVDDERKGILGRVDALREAIHWYTLPTSSFDPVTPREHARDALDADDRKASRLTSAPEDIKKARAVRKDEAGKLDDLRYRIATIERASGDAIAADAAEAEAREAVTAAMVAHNDAAAKLAALPAPRVLLTVYDTEPAEADHARAASDAGATQGNLAMAERTLAEAKASEERRNELMADKAKAAREMGKWSRLATDLGALASALVDAAGPQLTEMTNHILRTCVGSRWSVSIETQRSNSTGKRTIEDFNIRVFDAHYGLDKLAERMSGGEGAIVGEALSLGLAVVACKTAGITDCTLVRDETGAALDDEGMAAAYIRMLRLAVKEIGARQCLFVTHSPELKALADSRIEVRGGKVQVMAA